MDDMKRNVIEYYNNNARQYVKDTFYSDMTGIYSVFLSYISKHSKILDLGCGSGRDSVAFLNIGHSVVSVDPSKEICAEASKNSGLEIFNLGLEEMEYIEEFDGIWACASLLHLPKQELANHFFRIEKALKKNGVLYASWKYGNGERIENNRFYCDFTCDELKDFFFRYSTMYIEKIWKTRDASTFCRKQEWLNVIAKKR